MLSLGIQIASKLIINGNLNNVHLINNCSLKHIFQPSIEVSWRCGSDLASQLPKQILLFQGLILLSLRGVPIMCFGMLSSHILNLLC